LSCSLGYALTAFERGEFLQQLYRNLPDSENRVRTSKHVSDITTLNDGVIVSFEDGTSEKGSIVIGADGVWSTVRQIISKSAPPNAVDDKYWSSRYLCAYGRSSFTKGFPEAIMIDRHGKGWGFQGAKHFDQFIWLLFKPISGTQEKTTYSIKDEEVFWENVLDEKLLNDITLRQVWESRIVTGLTKLDSGVARIWHGDRVVMVGDANHKVSR
jgi:2-polyprenyl-6-methoxyphenol hydroxylase-like FAD-dependent oxidoreductase